MLYRLFRLVAYSGISADPFAPHIPLRQVVYLSPVDQPRLEKLERLLQIRDRACLVPHASESTCRRFVPLWQSVHISVHDPAALTRRVSEGFTDSLADASGWYAAESRTVIWFRRSCQLRLQIIHLPIPSSRRSGEVLPLWNTFTTHPGWSRFSQTTPAAPRPSSRPIRGIAYALTAAT